MGEDSTSILRPLEASGPLAHARSYETHSPIPNRVVATSVSEWTLRSDLFRSRRIRLIGPTPSPKMSPPCPPETQRVRPAIRRIRPFQAARQNRPTYCLDGEPPVTRRSDHWKVLRAKNTSSSV